MNLLPPSSEHRLPIRITRPVTTHLTMIQIAPAPDTISPLFKATPLPDSRPVIRQATTEEELEEIYRFRFAVYVEEMHRPQKYADHARKRIWDPLDSRGYVLGAWENDELVGTVRINFLAETDIGDYYEMYAFEEIPPFERSHSSITTRLMIHPRYRKGTLAIRIARALYRFGLERGILTDLIDCNAHLVRFFTGLGYQPHRTDLVHPEYGAVSVLKLSLIDRIHLQRIRSPFLPVLQDWLSTQNTPNRLIHR
jgi:hypothetical protein